MSSLDVGRNSTGDSSCYPFPTGTYTSNTCFSNGCGYYSSPETAICNPGTYVYQITGYWGMNQQYAGVKVTRFDIVCSDGYQATIGQSGSYLSYNKTIIDPQGYTEVLVGGGCITDHIQIGGTDFGNAGYGNPLSSCTCAPGLSFVGFGTLQYSPYWPSFPAMSIQCDVACAKGTYYSGGYCLPCPQGIKLVFVVSIIIGIGTYSFPGSTACSLNIVPSVGNGGLFALQVQSHATFVSAKYSSPAVMGTGSSYDTDQQFQYLSSTMQIYSPSKNLCLDDGGKETLGTSSLSAVLSFTTCNSSSINQQFIFTTGNQIYNPNWPNNQVCLNGNGNSYNGDQELILWGCSNNGDEIFNIVIICPTGSRYVVRLKDS